MDNLKFVNDALLDAKALDIVTIKVEELTTVTDHMVICSGTSRRHVQAIADKLVTEAKHLGNQPLSVTGKEQGEWILVDLADIVVHVMLRETRDHYNLEKLWDTTLEARSEAQS